MKKINLFLSSIAIIFICNMAFADLSIEQNCHTMNKSKSMMTGWSETTTGYKRRIFFVGQNLLSVQLSVNNIPTKEFGFDFENELYYEADLINNDYRQYTFDKINQEYAKLKTADIQSSAGMNIAKVMFGNMIGQSVDYNIKYSRSLFRRKKIGDFRCILYKYKIGPGYSAWSPMSWGKEIKAWITKDIPNYAEYEAVINKLKAEGAFYKAKANEISDLIIILMNSDGVPIETYDSAKHDFGMATSLQTGSAVFSSLETGEIFTHRLSYYKNTDKFIINPVAEPENKRAKPSNFMPVHANRTNLSLNAYPAPYKKETLLAKIYAFSIPMIFYVGLVTYIILRLTQKTSEPAGNKLLFRFYCTFALLYFLQIFHIFIPYYKSVEIEFSAILVLVSILIFGTNYIGIVRERKIAAQSTHAKVCPHCKTIIDKLCAVCSKCDKRVVN